ncbi:dolichyl-phosphate-mannose-protein mannosyltransferase [Legionella adelaidensis]|uniref:Dolichyl-phosphate-mannose-protein mannosyltransferase n=1 Tax=Legionella adelaidensis TaxID=45056 RepID=A0A0W0R503_9GAMM|nr:glycosyltransferase family 39 protein [Legionella adelaidensis]KTC66098.1 dolichyl-phosphate-mannose-protein mannosyltransferase [Legionella adelaidensis]
MTKIPPLLLLLIFSVVLFLPGIVSLPVIDRDEAHFAQASRQMLQSGQYFQIRFQDTTRFQKPPGINWLQAASVNLFSHPEATKIWPYRFPSFLGAFLSILLTFLFTKRFLGKQAALLSSALLASTLLLSVETHMAVIDASLLSSVLLMQGALWVIYHGFKSQQKVHWCWSLLFWLAMSYGMVLKGVTPLVGLLTIVTLCLWEKKISWLKEIHLFAGLGLFLLLSLTWVFLVNSAENSNYLVQMLHKDLLPKLQGGHESHGKPPLFHLAILPLTFWPASLFLWQGVSYALGNKNTAVVRFLLCWILPTWIFFELMPTKLPQYVLPTFPALAILCALGVIAWTTKIQEASRGKKWLLFLQLSWAILSLGLCSALFLLSYYLLNKVIILNIVWLIAISAMCIISTYFAFRGFYQRASFTVLLVALLTFPYVFANLLPPLKPLWISQNIAHLVNKEVISKENPLLVAGFSEPSLVFYLNTQKIKFVPIDNIVSKLAEHRQFLGVVDLGNLKELRLKTQNFFILSTTRGYNYNKGRWVKLFLISSKPAFNKLQLGEKKGGKISEFV